MKGVYVLKLALKKSIKLKVGSLGTLQFKKGSYYYIGSSQTNLIKRIERHIRKEKKIHWHIDYMTTNPAFTAIGAKKYPNYAKEKECELARNLLKKYCAIKGFGCSDCNCISHLFYNKEF